MRQSVRGIAVVIPAHDEQELLGACLASVRHALEHPRVRDLPSTVVVVLDHCTDRSRDVAQAHLRPADLLIDTSSRNVGAARALGCRVALDHLHRHGLSAGSSWLAHTDADTRVPSWWIARHLHYARTADAVAGVVRVDDWSQHPLGTEHRFSRHYGGSGHATKVEASGIGHPHVHGANLGVRGDAYLRAGGFPSVSCSEDHGLWNAIARGGDTMLSSRRLWVTTSGRRAGRAPGGFADALTELAVGQERGREIGSSTRRL